MAALECYGSTSSFFRVRPEVILKSPTEVWKESGSYHELTREFSHSFSVERQLLERLGNHPRIVRIPRRYQHAPGLLLAEANLDNLQQYIDEHGRTIALSLRKKRYQQTVESIAYLHSQGVVHSDLRPKNFLIHATSASLDIWLCDFGGSTCESLGLDGGHLPDSGFFDPTQGDQSTPATDIFSLGSILYAILTGHWPYKPSGPFKTIEEMDEYGQRVDALFSQGKYPDMGGLVSGQIILGCWTKKYSSAAQILRNLETEMLIDDDKKT